MVELAVRAQLGEKLKEMGAGTGLLPDIPFAVVKAPVFSTVKLTGVDPVLGPEMKSTGEVLGLGSTFPEAAGKAFCFKDNIFGKWQEGQICLVSLADADKTAAVLPALERLQELGAVWAATPGTAEWMRNAGFSVAYEICGQQELTELVQAQPVAFAMITATKGNRRGRSGFALRSRALQLGVPLFTSTETFDLYVQSISEKRGVGHAICEDIGSISKRAVGQF